MENVHNFSSRLVCCAVGLMKVIWDLFSGLIGLNSDHTIFPRHFLEINKSGCLVVYAKMPLRPLSCSLLTIQRSPDGKVHLVTLSGQIVSVLRVSISSLSEKRF